MAEGKGPNILGSVWLTDLAGKKGKKTESNHAAVHSTGKWLVFFASLTITALEKANMRFSEDVGYLFTSPRGYNGGLCRESLSLIRSSSHAFVKDIDFSSVSIWKRWVGWRVKQSKIWYKKVLRTKSLWFNETRRAVFLFLMMWKRNDQYRRTMNKTK